MPPEWRGSTATSFKPYTLLQDVHTQTQRMTTMLIPQTQRMTTMLIPQTQRLTIMFVHRSPVDLKSSFRTLSPLP
jgi:hypothetical protein